MDSAKRLVMSQHITRLKIEKLCFAGFSLLTSAELKGKINRYSMIYVNYNVSSFSSE